MKKILIFGGSGFLGRAIFKELNPFFDLYCTYYKNLIFKKNKRFFYFDVTHNPKKIIEKIQPSIIVSSISGDFYNQVTFHDQLINYCESKKTKLFFYHLQTYLTISPTTLVSKMTKHFQIVFMVNLKLI